MFVIDMSEGFAAMDAMKRASLRQRFEYVFREPFVRTTYFDQRSRWRAATEEQRVAAVVAGRTADGLWTAFQRAVQVR
jgi:hypothetical protein